MIVKSFGSLQTFSSASSSVSSVALSPQSYAPLDSMSAATYAAIYRSQPNVRTVIDFIARNIAQIGLHAYRRISDLDRERLADHDVLEWLEHPNPGTSRYRLMQSLMIDLGIYFNAYILKVRREDGGIGLVRIPPEQMCVEGWLIPTGFVWTVPDGTKIAIPRDQVIYVNGYDPNNPLMGLSPLETLRLILIEDAASTAYRQNYWRNASRIEGVITRPAGAPKWTVDQKQAFREQWQTRYGAGAGAGQTAVLEDGMQFTPTAFSARDSEFVPARKLTREEVASAYHVPLPMVGILDHATFSNIREQHKQLYQDCLGPWLQLLEEELERQLLPDAEDNDRVYLEFNIAEKLKGSFEEQAASIQVLTGRPVMTANEGRARLNLPRVTDDASADQLALPLNTAASGAPSALAAGDLTPSVGERIKVLEGIIDDVESEAA